MHPLFRALGGTALLQPLASSAGLRIAMLPLSVRLAPTANAATAALALGLLLASLSPAFAQDITINHRVLDAVYGNGTGQDGAGPPNADHAANNSVTVNSGGDVWGTVYGGFATSDSGAATASDNSVTVKIGGNASGTVYGGFATSDSGTATASGNKIIISGGELSEGYGGSAYSASGSAAASGNSVTISGVTVRTNVYGGLAHSQGLGSSASASNNTVIISGGVVPGHVFGGMATSEQGGAAAINNTVTISGNPTFSPDSTILYGGYGLARGSSDFYTGNTLNIYSKVTVLEIINFEFINYNLSANAATAGGSMLTVTGTANLTDGEGIAGNRTSTVTANTVGGTAPLQPGTKVTLIDASAGPSNGGEGLITNNAFMQTLQAKGQHGATVSYLWTLDTADNKLTATLDSVQASPQAKALSEGFLSGVALINQGADLIAGRGVGEAVGAGKHVEGASSGSFSGYGFGSFAAVSGGWSRYNTGSHVDVSGLSLIAGLSFGADLPPGHLTLGAFFEWGTGSYNTSNSFNNAPDVNGKGNSYYLGGGILGRMDFLDTGPGNFYAEASARMGGLNNSYNSGDLRDPMGRRADYDAYSPYYGVHAGLGYIWKFTEQASLDLYGKYFWTRQQGVDVRLSTGDPVKFKDADSHRLRLGGRLNYAINDYVAPYIGAAWEYEMDGRAKATTYGYNMDTPTLFGSAGVGELGLVLKPSKTLPLSFDLGVQGYVGKREGVTSSLQIRYEF